MRPALKFNAKATSNVTASAILSGQRGMGIEEQSKERKSMAAGFPLTSLQCLCTVSLRKQYKTRLTVMARKGKLVEAIGYMRTSSGDQSAATRTREAPTGGDRRLRQGGRLRIVDWFYDKAVRARAVQSVPASCHARPHRRQRRADDHCREP